MSGGIADEDLSTGPGAARVHPETGWNAVPLGESHESGSGGAGGRQGGAGADL